RVQRDGDRRREGPARHPGPDARHGVDADPAREPGDSSGGRRRRVLPVLALVELRARAGPQHHRRAVHGDDHVTSVSVVGSDELEELLPLMRAYADFYGVAPTDDQL